MKKTYIAPEMEILDAETQGFLAASKDPHYEPGQGGEFCARQDGAGFEEDDEDF